MKLRLRCLESKQTLRIQLPTPYTLHQLQQTLSLSLSPPPPSPSSLRFSLNARDELSPSSSDASLESLGVTAGDLVYFSLNPNAFSPNPEALVQGSRQMHEPCTSRERSIPGTQIQEPMSNQPENLGETTNLGINCPNQETAVPGLPQIQNIGSNQSQVSQGTHMQCMNCSNRQTALQDLSVQEQSKEFSNTQGPGGFQETMETGHGTLEEAETMEIDGGSGVKKFSEPYFLRRVLREELGNDGSDHKLLVIAVHAVFLESGFIGIDSVSRRPIDGFHLPEDWPSSSFTVSLWYSLPELLSNSNSVSNMTDYVVMKFQILGHFINVHACLAKGGSSYRVCLDEGRFAQTLDSVWANCEKNDRMDEDGSLKPYPENEVFNFWRIVKDGLALPLWIDLCERTGLAPPACLRRLPTELKLKVFESLSGVDIARMGCVCTEMRYLASNNDLWKQKFTEEFGDGTTAQGMVNWRDKFVSNWEKRKKRKLAVALWRDYPRPERSFNAVYRRNPNPFGVFPMIGGDYDLLPVPAVNYPFARSGLAFTQSRPRQNFRPYCNLGRTHGAEHPS
ncbi:hypothetical protein SLE2022_205800 [Rubroshorea leprosula]